MRAVNSFAKKAIYNYWDTHPCISFFTSLEQCSKKYFDDDEEYMYRLHPYIFSFAQFTRYPGKKILEVGVGAGRDFVQWVRNGCVATGCDLTPKAVELTRKRLKVYGLEANVQQEDCENLSFSDESFDLVYCLGVIHHTLDPQKAVSEIYRVLKKGGIAKVMLYHRHSWVAFNHWVAYGLMGGKPLRSIDDIMASHMENKGTKVYSIKQAKKLFHQFSQVDIYNQVTPYDHMAMKGKVSPCIANLLISALNSRIGWNLMVTATK